MGNEVILTGILPEQDLIAYIDHVRGSVHQWVGTAETWNTWMLHPELVKHVDFLGVHMLPYWEGVDVNQAVNYIDLRMQDLEKAYPDKPIVIDEVGWPSYGRTRDAAVASPANQALFLRRFLDHAEEHAWSYRVDGGLRPALEGADRGRGGRLLGRMGRGPAAEVPVAPPHREHPEMARARRHLGVDGGTVPDAAVRPQRDARKRGRSFLAVVVYATSTTFVWVFYDYTQQYLSITSVAVGSLLFTGMVGVILVLLAEAHEWAEAHWVTVRRRAFEPQCGHRCRTAHGLGARARL